MNIVQGRPDTAAGRTASEMQCYDFLDRLGVSYRRVDHPATATMEACAEVDVLLGADTCKNLLLCNRQQTAFYLLLIPGDKVFRSSALSHEIGSSRLSFAPGEKMEELLGISPGSLSILGLMNDRQKKVQLLIDAPVLEQPYFGCHPCVNTASLGICTADLQARIIPALGHTPVIVHLP